MEGLFRGKGLSASPVVLRRHQRATTGRTDCVIYGIRYQMKMWVPGRGQGSHSWLTGDPQGFPASQLPTQPSMAVGSGGERHCLPGPETLQAHNLAWLSPQLCSSLHSRHPMPRCRHPMPPCRHPRGAWSAVEKWGKVPEGREQAGPGKGKAPHPAHALLSHQPSSAKHTFKGKIKNFKTGTADH